MSFVKKKKFVTGQVPIPKIEKICAVQSIGDPAISETSGVNCMQNFKTY
jgi:hypothetical protein